MIATTECRFFSALRHLEGIVSCLKGSNEAGVLSRVYLCARGTLGVMERLLYVCLLKHSHWV